MTLGTLGKQGQLKRARDCLVIILGRNFYTVLILKILIFKMYYIVYVHVHVCMCEYSCVCIHV